MSHHTSALAWDVLRLMAAEHECPAVVVLGTHTHNTHLQETAPAAQKREVHMFVKCQNQEGIKESSSSGALSTDGWNQGLSGEKSLDLAYPAW